MNEGVIFRVRHKSGQYLGSHSWGQGLSEVGKAYKTLGHAKGAIANYCYSEYSGRNYADFVIEECELVVRATHTHTKRRK